ncbi:MAG: septum site-determining protein MinC [Firmicutes bacterium]|nr:septum site-determining protein MinC [Bacillota bacterium]
MAAQPPEAGRDPINGWPTLLVRRTLRSGQKVRYVGNVVVLGDVNPGAEITAEGDIVVMGWLRGVVHAGANGDIRATVAAFRLTPTQIRIGPYIARAPDTGDAGPPEAPEVALVRDGRLVIDRWRKSALKFRTP